MTMMGRSPITRHVQRTHRIDWDWLFERFLYDKSISMKYIHTKSQTADIFTKGSFTKELWTHLCKLANCIPNPSKHLSFPESKAAICTIGGGVVRGETHSLSGLGEQNGREERKEGSRRRRRGRKQKASSFLSLKVRKGRVKPQFPQGRSCPQPR